MATQPISEQADIMDQNQLGRLLAPVARRWWLALLVFGVVMAADIYYTATRQPTYLARATFLIGPSPVVERGQLIFSIDALGRGRLVGTYAEVMGSEAVQQEALQRLSDSAEAAPLPVTFGATALAESLVIQVTAESPDPASSARAANALGEVGADHLQILYPMYNLVPLTKATAPASPHRPEPARNYSLGVLFGVVLALVMTHLLETGLRTLRQRHADVLPGADARPAGERSKPGGYHGPTRATGRIVWAPRPREGHGQDRAAMAAGAEPELDHAT